jgi:phosphopantetheinyl transferase
MHAFASPRPDTHVEALRIERPDGVFQAAFCLARAAWPVLREEREHFLHPDERDYFSSLKFERRQISYLIGRYCAKQALVRLSPGAPPGSIAIRHGVFQHPVVRGAAPGAQVGISHAADWGAAVAFPEEHPMGVDIEEINGEKAATIRTQVTPAEFALVAPLAGGEIRALTLLWTAKEAMAKTIRCGMMTPFSVFEVASAGLANGAIECAFANFAQYKATSYLLGDLAVSLVVPKKSALHLAFPAQLNG